MVDYEIGTIIEDKYEIVVERTVKALKKEGFGVLTEIDVQKTLKEKLNADFERYIILGACNPPFARKALEVEREVGLLLPCNVIVQELEEGTRIKVAAIDPEKMFEMTGNPLVAPIAKEVKTKLQQVIRSLSE